MQRNLTFFSKVAFLVLGGYISGRILRSDLCESRFTKYTISIIHQFLKDQYSKEQLLATNALAIVSAFGMTVWKGSKNCNIEKLEGVKLARRKRI